MTCCVAYGCTNRWTKKIPGITFHNFPKDEKRKQKWIIAVRRKNWKPSKRSKLCSAHFTEDMIDRTSLSCVRLRENAVPVIFDAFPSYLQQKYKPRKSPSNRDKVKVTTLCVSEQSTSNILEKTIYVHQFPSKEESDESILQQLPNLGIVKIEPVDPDIAIVEEPSSSCIASTAPEAPVSYEVPASPLTILPDLSPGESPSTSVPTLIKDEASETSPHETCVRPAIKRRRSDDGNDPDPSNATQSCSGIRDEFTVFGEFVATKLRNLKLRQNQLVAQNAITQLLTEIEMKDIDKDIFSLTKVSSA